MSIRWNGTSWTKPTLSFIHWIHDVSPVIYTCFGQTRKRDNPEAAVTHLCRCLEDMIVLMRKMEEDATAEKKPEDGKPEEKKKLSELVKGGKWTWVVDFEDFG